MVFGAEDADFELADGEEVVVFGIVKVNDFDGGAFGLGGAVFGDAGVFLEEVEEVAVVFEEGGAGKGGGEAGDDFFDLVGLEPGVEGVELLAEDGEEGDLGEGFAVAVAGFLVHFQVEDLPAEACELVKEGFFDVAAFVELGGLGGFV